MLRVRIAPVLVAIAMCLLWGGLPMTASAQPVSVVLTLLPATVTFTDADPDTTPTITSPSMAVTVDVSGDNVPYSWLLTLAATNLTTGSATILISNVTWTATPSPFVANGTVSTTAQTVASGNTSCVKKKCTYLGTGTFIFSLANSWSYNAGVYTSTFTFVLSAP
jgi:hypothetical protein